MKEADRKKIRWIIIIGLILLGLFFFQCMIFNVWMLAYPFTTRKTFHAIWVYVFMAVAIACLISSVVLIYKTVRKPKQGVQKDAGSAGPPDA